MTIECNGRYEWTCRCWRIDHLVVLSLLLVLIVLKLRCTCRHVMPAYMYNSPNVDDLHMNTAEPEVPIAIHCLRIRSRLLSGDGALYARSKTDEPLYVYYHAESCIQIRSVPYLSFAHPPPPRSPSHSQHSIHRAHDDSTLAARAWAQAAPAPRPVRPVPGCRPRSRGRASRVRHGARRTRPALARARCYRSHARG